ncbi:MAG: T9SS type A sorting domain-containing protein [Chitinophagales bacterium]|nr:T9SS type A sorting domain-containing protein [Chitinophagales bacterium]
MKTKREISKLVMMRAIVFVLLALWGLHTQAAIRKWTNGNGTGLWSDSLNWTPIGVPTYNDTVVYDATSGDDCRIDILNTTSVRTIELDSTYTGTVSMGQFSAYVEDMIIEGGTFISTSDTLAASTLKVIGGTFLHNNGTVYFLLDGADKYLTGQVTFNNLLFNLPLNPGAPPSMILDSLSVVEVLGNLTYFSNMTYPVFTNGEIHVKGNYYGYGPNDRIWRRGTTKFIFDGSGTSHIYDFGNGLSCKFSGMPNLVVNKAPNDTLILHNDTVGHSSTWLYQSGVFIVDSVYFNATIVELPNCTGKTFKANVAGAIGSVDYYWYSGGNRSSTDTLITSPPNNVAYIYFTDSIGCRFDSAFIFSYNIFTPYADFMAPTCISNGAIEAQPTGGIPPYSYTWSNGGTGAQITNLSAGSYSYTAVDANACSVTLSVNLSPNLMTATMDSTFASCSSCCDASIMVHVSGGVPPYSYTWSNGVVFQTNDTLHGINNLCPDNYSVTITDSTNCSIIKSIAIPCSFSVEILSTPILCSHDTVTLTASHSSPDSIVDYQWSNGVARLFSWIDYWNPSQSNATAIFGVTVTDNQGCIGSDTILLQFPDSINPNAQVIDASCQTCTDGSITLNPSGGVPPYSYSWSTADITQHQLSLMAATYNVTITDANGCAKLDSFEVQAINSVPNVYIWGPVINNNYNIDCHGNCNGVLNAQVTGGVPPYTYHWSNNAITDTITNLCAGIYYVTITDSLGQSSIDTIELTEPPLLVVTDSVIDASCQTCADGAVLAYVSGGALPYVYNWSPPNSQTSQLSNLLPGSYALTVLDGNGCVIGTSGLVGVFCDSGCVWPGDADYNGLVDADDVLPIGIGYGIAGPLRSNASLVWQAQPATDWADTLLSGSNYKHVDTDGNGLINEDDTLAVSLNYGLSHPKAEPKGGPNDPALYFVFPDDTVAAGQPIAVPVYLGTSAIPVTNIYGISFHIIHNGLVDSNTAYVDISNSWLGTSGIDLFSFRKDLYPQSKTAAAVSRKDRVNVGGFGQIATIHYTMKDDISGKDEIAVPLTLSFTDVKAILADGSEVLINTDSSITVVVVDSTVGIKEPLAQQLKVYPNPANDRLYMQNGKMQVKKVSILNLLGQVLRSPEIAEIAYGMDIHSFEQGVYILQIVTENGEQLQERFTIAR